LWLLAAIALAAGAPLAVAATPSQTQKLTLHISDRDDCLLGGNVPQPLAAQAVLTLPRTWTVAKHPTSDACQSPQAAFDRPHGDVRQCRGNEVFVNGADNHRQRFSLHDFLRAAGGRELAAGRLPSSDGMRGAWVHLKARPVGDYLDAAFEARDRGEFYEMTVFPDSVGDGCRARDAAAALRASLTQVESYRVRFTATAPREGTAPR
jgi:hypothetical protein